MDAALALALGPVFRDLTGTGRAVPTISDRPWTDDPDQPSAHLLTSDGGSIGVWIHRSMSAAEQVASAADQVQEWEIEESWGTHGTNWPACPLHPDTHPLSAEVVDARPMWICPRNGAVVSPIGALATARDQKRRDRG